MDVLAKWKTIPSDKLIPGFLREEFFSRRFRLPSRDCVPKTSTMIDFLPRELLVELLFHLDPSSLSALASISLTVLSLLNNDQVKKNYIQKNLVTKEIETCWTDHKSDMVCIRCMLYGENGIGCVEKPPMHEIKYFATYLFDEQWGVERVWEKYHASVIERVVSPEHTSNECHYEIAVMTSVYGYQNRSFVGCTGYSGRRLGKVDRE